MGALKRNGGGSGRQKLYRCASAPKPLIDFSIRVPPPKWGRWRDSHSRVAMCPAVYETAAVAAEPNRRENGLPAVALSHVKSSPPSHEAMEGILHSEGRLAPRCCPL